MASIVGGCGSAHHSQYEVPVVVVLAS